MNKRILFIICAVLMCCISFAQSWGPTQVPQYNPDSRRSSQRALHVGETMHIPAGGQPSLGPNGYKGDGAIFIDSVSKAYYYYVDSVFYNLADANCNGFVDIPSVTYAGVPFHFKVSKSRYNSDCKRYNADTLTLVIDEGDTLARKDVIYADSTGYHIKKGEPSETPARPTLDAGQLFITDISVPAFDSLGTGISQLIVYNENIESTLTGVGTTVAGNSTAAPYIGTYNTRITTINSGDYWKWVKSSGVWDLTTATGLGFPFQLRATMPLAANLRVSLWLDNVQVSQEATLTINRSNTTAYQFPTIPITAFYPLNSNTVNEVRVRYTSNNGNNYLGFDLDYIHFGIGLGQPAAAGAVNSVDFVIGGNAFTITGPSTGAVLKNLTWLGGSNQLVNGLGNLITNVYPSSLGAVDGQAANAQGGAITGNTFYQQSATDNFHGLFSPYYKKSVDTLKQLTAEVLGDGIPTIRPIDDFRTGFPSFKDGTNTTVENVGDSVIKIHASVGGNLVFNLPLVRTVDTVEIAEASTLNDGYLSAVNYTRFDSLRNHWYRGGAFGNYLRQNNTADSVIIGVHPGTVHKFNVTGNIFWEGTAYTTSNRRMMEINTALQNVDIGGRSGNASRSGTENTSVGEFAGSGITASNYNTFFGKGVGAATMTGAGNTAIGRNTYASGTITGDYNVVMAYNGANPVHNDSSYQVNIAHALLGLKGRFKVGGRDTPTPITANSIYNPTAVFDIDTIHGYANLRLRKMSANPVWANDGNIWHYNDHIYARLNGVNYQLDQQSGGGFFSPDQTSTGATVHNSGSNDFTVTGTSGSIRFEKVVPGTGFGYFDVNGSIVDFHYGENGVGSWRSSLSNVGAVTYAKDSIGGDEAELKILGDQISLYQQSGVYKMLDIPDSSVAGTHYQVVWNDADDRLYKRSLGAGGGGGGSGTVNSGTANRLAYYPSTGTTVDDLAAITANRALISDANGLPTHSATTNTELGYVSGVTSAIQTQLNGKQGKTVGTYSTRTGLSPSDGDEFFQTDDGRDSPPGKYYYLNSKWNYVPYADERLIKTFDDFHSLGSANTISGSFVLTSTGSITPTADGARFSTAAGTTGRAVVFSGANGTFGGWIDLDNGHAYYKINIKAISALSSGTDEYILRVGLGDATAGADWVNGLYVEYDRLTSTNWGYVSALASSRSRSASSTAVTAAAHYIEIFYNGTQAEYWVDGTSLGTKSTQIPTAVISPIVQLVKSAGTTPVTVDVDYVKAWHYLTTSRN